MANVVNGKKVIYEVNIDEEEEEEEEEDDNESEEVRDCKLTLSKFNESQIEQRRGDKNGFYCDEDDSMDYEITRINQPVDFIFAVEDDDGVETELGSHKVFSNETPIRSILLNSKDSVKSVPDKSNQAIRSTRSAIKQQPNLQNKHSTSSSTPTITKSIEKKKVKPSESVDPTPSKQLRSSVRENRNVQNKPIAQPAPNEPRTNGKKSTNTSSNTTPSIKPTPNEPKSAIKATNSSTGNSTSAPSGGPKSGKKTVNGNKESMITPSTKATSINGKQNGVLNNGAAKSIQKSKSSTDTPTSVNTQQTSAKKRTRSSYWTGKEHNRLIGPESPFVMIERLPMFLSGDSEYKGHDCLKTVCPSKRNLVRRKSPVPPPRVDSITATINSVAKDVPLSPNMPPGRPRIGQNIRFQFWQTPLGNNVPVKSSYQKAKIVDYYQQYDLYEIELFHYDHPFVISMDKTKNQRVTTNTMIIDWNSLADPSVI